LGLRADAYGFSWLFWIPEALTAHNIWNAPEGVKNSIALNLAAWSPLVGAIVTTFIYQKGAGVKELLKRGLMTRLGKCWWAVLLSFPVLIGGTLALSILLGDPAPEFETLAQPIGRINRRVRNGFNQTGQFVAGHRRTGHLAAQLL